MSAAAHTIGQSWGWKTVDVDDGGRGRRRWRSGRQEGVPAAHLLGRGGAAHFVPVQRLAVGRALEAQRHPAEQFATLQAALVDHRRQQRHLGQLEQRHLRTHSGNAVSLLPT